jgi:hypothetical protein
LSLEQPKEEYQELNPEERKRVVEAVKKGLEITFE